MPLLTNADDSAEKARWVPDPEKSTRLNQLNASELLAKCFADLKRRPPADEMNGQVPDPEFEFGNVSSNLAHLGAGYFEEAVGSTSCFSPGNFFGTLELARYTGDWTLYSMLLRQWLEMHSFIASQGLEEHELNMVLRSANSADQIGAVGAASSSVDYEKLLDVVESGIWLVLQDLSQVRPPDNVLVYPDVRGGTGIPSPTANPQYEQSNGPLPALLETVAGQLRILTQFLQDESLQTYEESVGQYSPRRTHAARRYGHAIRTALLAETLALNLHDRAVRTCQQMSQTCSTIPWEGRWKNAMESFRGARSAAVAAGNRLVRVENPLGISEFDLPVFFGDPVGTNSKYFASSDYLLDRWAVPAVAAASNQMDQARQAWVSQRNSILQDELSTGDRERRLDGLAEQYGRPIIQDCGFDVVDSAVVDGAAAIKLISSGTATPNNCYVDKTCPGFLDAWNPTQQINDAAAQADTQTVKYTACVIERSTRNMTTAPISVAEQLQTVSPHDEVEVKKGVLWAGKLPEIQCILDHVDTLSLVKTGAEPKVHSPDCAEDVALSRIVSLDIEGPNPLEIVAKARQSCAEDYGFKPLEAPKIPPSCLRGRLGEAVGAGIAATNGLTKALADLSLAQQQLSAKEATCLLLNQSELQRQELSYDVHLARDVSIQTSINAAATSQMFSLDGWIQQAFVAYQDYVPQAIDGAVNGFGTGVDKSVDGLNTVYNYSVGKVVGFFGGSSSNPIPSPNASNWHGPSAQDTEAAKLWALHKHSNGLADRFATQAEAVADQGQYQRAEGNYQQWVDKQRALEAAGSCWLEYHSMKVGLDSQLAIIDQNMTEVQRAALAASNIKKEVSSLASNGAAAIAREKNRKWDGYAFHYWFNEKVDKFKRDFDWSRRLTYLAARAVEYEFQQSLPFRTAVLTAHHPDQLEQVIRILQQEQAGRTINRRRPDEASVVLSLRDDILRIADRSTAPAGERNWSPAQRMKGRLRSSAFVVRDRSGNIVGQGVPFTLDPLAGGAGNGIALQSRCGERLWRVNATIQGDGLSSREPGAPLLLLKRNSFAAQFCANHGDGVPMHSVSMQPSRQLFRPDDQALPNDESFDYTAAQIYPWFNVRRTDFYKASYLDGDSEELAGRGLYGDYVLLFPQQLVESGFPIEKVEDVLIRFDYLSVDNLPQISKTN